MSFLGALAAVGGSLLGGLFQNEREDRIADTQVAQSREAIAEQRAAREQAERLAAPAINMGNSARDLYGASFGLAPTSGATRAGVQAPTYALARPRGYSTGGDLDYGAGRDYRGTPVGTPANWYASIGTGESSFSPYSQGGYNVLANFPGVGAEPPPQQTPEDLQNMAYDRFMTGGYNRAATDFTNNDLDQLRGAYGAGGSLLSGSAVGAMGDRLARNRYGAYVDHQNALAGLAGAATAGSSALASQGQATANNISNMQIGIGQARASSYANQTNPVETGVNALGQYGANKGWF